MKWEKLILSLCLSFLLGIASLSSAQETSVTHAPPDLVQWLIQYEQKRVHLSTEELEALNQKLKCEPHDLNGDGTPEFLVHIESHFWCGAGTNCHFWMVQKTRTGYRLLLEDTCIQVRNTVSNGYKDLISEESMGSRMEVIYKRGKPVRADRQEIAVRVYKYEGKRYQLRRSYDKFIPFEH